MEWSECGLSGSSSEDVGGFTVRACWDVWGEGRRRDGMMRAEGQMVEASMAVGG